MSDHEALLDRAERKGRSNVKRGVLNAWITTGVSGVGAVAGGVAVGLVLSGRVLTAYPGLQMLALLTALVATTLSVFGVSQGLKLRREYKALWAAERQALSTMRSQIEGEDQ